MQKLIVYIVIKITLKVRVLMGGNLIVGFHNRMKSKLQTYLLEK